MKGESRMKLRLFALLLTRQSLLPFALSLSKGLAAENRVVRQAHHERNQIPFIAVLICALLSGCATTSRLTPPEISVTNVAMTSADVFNQQFRMRIHVYNPNTLELQVKSIEYQLFLEGDGFADGTVDQPFVLPAHGNAEFDTIINTHFTSSLMRLIAKMQEHGNNTVQYDFTGKVHLSKGLMRNIPFQKHGIIDLGIKK